LGKSLKTWLTACLFLWYDKSYFSYLTIFMKKNHQAGVFVDEEMFYGTTVIGARGQLVVPKEIREKLKVKSGDKFFVVGHYGKIILIPEAEARLVVNRLTKHLKNFTF